jgi:uncharacterized protein
VPDPALDGYPVAPPPLGGPAYFDQTRAMLTFVHWPVEPASVAHLYPPGTRPDVFADGMTYVALVPFIMSRTAIGRSVPLPYFGSFAETNIRLYSVDDVGRHGVLFRSLETARLAVVPMIRIGMGVPYTWARMRVTRTGDRITYTSVRRWPQHGLRSRLSVVIGDPVEPTLRAAEITDIADDLLPASGIQPAGPRLRALFFPGVRARFGCPFYSFRAGFGAFSQILPWLGFTALDKLRSPYERRSFRCIVSFRCRHSRSGGPRRSRYRLRQ